MNIDYYTLGGAQNFFVSAGYEYLDVPWMIAEEASNATRPIWAQDVRVSPFDRTLVASGEQSFIELMLTRKWAHHKACCITPCFRVEQEPHKYHLPYFMKLELINTRDANTSGLIEMLHDVMGFLDHYLPNAPGNEFDRFYKIEKMGPDEYDIVGKKSGVEIGSYGIRSYKEFKWVYGTGAALPRLSQVMELERQMR